MAQDVPDSVTSPQTEAPKAPKAPRPRRWLRRLVLLLVILVLLVVASPLALALPFVKNMVASSVGEGIGREVTIDKIFAFWGKGLDIDGLTVASPPGFDEPLARVQHIHVDVALLALLGGKLEASVLVDTPRVTILEHEDGRSNLDGLVAEKTEAAPSDDPAAPPPEATPGEAKTGAKGDAGPGPHIRVEIRNGSVRAQPAAGADPEEIENIQAVLALTPEGAVALEFSATALRAALGGGDVPVAIGASLTGEGNGPVKIEIPALDLARISTLAGELGGLESLEGQLAVSADGEIQGTSSGIGRLVVDGKDIALRTKAGLTLSIGKVSAEAKVSEADDKSVADVSVRLERVGIVDGSRGEAQRFEEPLVELTLKGTHDAKTEVLLVEAMKLQAGPALSVTASQPWTISTGDKPSAKGQLDIQADLASLARLEAIVPALSSIESGRVAARIVAETADGMDVKAGIRAVGVRLAPGVLSPEGYTEREIVVQAHATRPAGEGDLPTSIVVHRIQTSFLTFGPAPGTAGRAAEPLTIQLLGSDVGARGRSLLNVNLQALGAALGGAMGLEAGDRLGGTLVVTVDADASGGEGRATATIAGRQIALPASWAKGVPPTDLAGETTIALGKDEIRAEVKRLEGFGLTLVADAVLGRGDEGAGGLQHANVQISGDLARARPLLGPFLEIPADVRLQGVLDARTQIVEGADARSLKGTVTVKGLRWQEATGQVLFEEPHLELRHDLAMAAGESAYTVREFTLKSRALQLEVQGTYAPGNQDALNPSANADEAIQAAVRVRGDAPQLASVLRGFLGEDYRDLKGSGSVTGSVNLAGSFARGGETLIVGGDLKPGDWSVGGLTVNGAVLTLRKQQVQDPLTVAFRAGVNGGTASVETHVRLRENEKPFTAKVDVKQVDTSPLLADRGFGKYLGYVVPTLIPTDSDTPVLSGRLDANVELQAASLSGPKLAPSLRGKGSIRMTQGAIAQSTLFQAIGGGRGLGQAGTMLIKAVPEVGSSLASLTRSLNFSKIESVFAIANEIVNVQRGLLESQQTRIDFKGNVGFDQRIDLAIDLALTGGKAAERLGRVLPSKTIPMRVRGTLDKPQIQPNLDVKDLATGALEGLIPIPGRGSGGERKNPLEGLKDLIPR